MADRSKRYIVTFQEPQVAQQAFSALGIAAGDVVNGVSALMEAEAPPPDQVLQFEDLGSAVLSLNENQADRLRQSAQVAEVVEDFEVPAHAAPSPDVRRGNWIFPAPWDSDLAERPRSGLSVDPELLQWNISLVRAQEAWQYATGKGVKVAVIDSGIDSKHPDVVVKGGASLVEGVDSWEDDHGHGTHCAGILGARNFAAGSVGVAPECDLYAVKVLRAVGNDARGNLSWILAGMQWALQNGMKVVSMSLGSPVESELTPGLVAYQRAAQALFDNGCIVISSAGNSFGTPQPWVNQPARCEGFVPVASVDQNREIAATSSRGPASLANGIVVSAPGVSIRSTINGGGYRVMSGTSMACPHVSGAAALVGQRYPHWTAAQIRDRLRQTAEDLGDVVTFGAGLLNCLAAVQ